MQSHQEDAPLKAKKKKLRSHRCIKKRSHKSLDIAPVDIENDDDRSLGRPQNQLVLYNPSTDDTGQEVLPVLDPTENTASSTSSFPNFMIPNPSSRVLPSVGAFTVQCAICFKWRLIPTKEKYEEIRESILQEPFVCERAREWRPDISCDDPADISQDGSRLWAIDKPNIAQPPPGWERILRIRGEGSTKFADVYYAAPSGKKLRSMVEIQKYLLEHPEYIRGVNLSQFSFQIPKPLQENYVRKRNARATNPYESAGVGLSRPLEPTEEVNPLSWVDPVASTELQIGGPGLSSPYYESPDYFHPPEQPPAKKKSTMPSSKEMYDSSVLDQPKIKVEDSHHARNTSLSEL